MIVQISVVDDLIELEFRLADRSDIVSRNYSASRRTVASPEEKVAPREWPRGLCLKFDHLKSSYFHLCRLCCVKRGVINLLIFGTVTFLHDEMCGPEKANDV